TFADQAVIAIENVRLFKEIQERNAELREALEHQTATSEVLGIISRSPTDVQPVLDAIVESAARVCGIDDVLLRFRNGNTMVSRSHFGPIPISRVEASVDEPWFRWIREHGTLHIPDVRAAQNDFPMLGSAGTWRTWLVVPLCQQGELIGSLGARRIEVRRFTPVQIKLLETFADQAVIAIEHVRLFQELKESLEHQTATSEILGVIASSPTDLQPVLDTIAENAARVCGSYDAVIRLVEGNILRMAAHHGPTEPGFGLEQPLTRSTIGGRAVIDRQTIHIHDLLAESETEFAASIKNAQRLGHRTFLATPLLREGSPIGVILIRREEFHPFSENQIALLKTFADQAVIAIENVRLFRELQDRNAELREALEHQTATSEVLSIISRSPTDVRPVLDAIVESAARVCGIDNLGLRLREGNNLVSRAQFGPIPAGRAEISVDEPAPRWIREHGTLHVPDVSVQNDFQIRNSSGSRHFLFLPLRHKGEVVGTLTARRFEVHPFTPAQIKLLETFADQAVIAIENVRLFNEIKESLEQQAATSEILGGIASSPTDPQPVFQTILDNALRLCEAQNGAVFRFDGEVFRAVAWHNISPAMDAFVQSTPIRPGRESALRRVGLEKRPVHIPDMLADPEWIVPEPYREEGMRSNLAVPLLKENDLLGAIAIHRREVRPFTKAQIKLLEIFADQAVIAIENVRLFQELKHRTGELETS